MSESTSPTLKPIRIMIDMETAATGPEAAILTLGAVVFDTPIAYDTQRFYQRASLLSNEQLGRKIDKATLAWWDKQAPEIRKEAFCGSQAVDDLLNNFRLFCEYIAGIDGLDKVELWSRGAGFDCEILQHAYYQIFGKYPFDFRNHMCQRTVEKLMPRGLVSLVEKNKYKHNAVEDAIHQAKIIDLALRSINWE